MPVLKLYEITTPVDDTTQNNYEIAPNPKTFSYNDNTTSYEGSTYVCWEGKELIGDNVTEPRMIKRFKHTVNDTMPDVLTRLVAEREEYSDKFGAILNTAAVNFGIFLNAPSVEHATEMYIIQQLFDGTTLNKVEPENLKKELMYASSVAGTLQQLENKGYVYGDIKAENLLVKTGSTDIMFFDLNSSRSLSQIQRDKRISTNSLCPLNLDLNSNSNLKTIDIYMLGQLLAHRLLKDADQLLLTEIAENEMDIQTFRSHLRTFEDDHFLTNAVARKLLALLKKALAVCSRDRFQSAEEIKKDLEEIIEVKYQLVAKEPSCIDRAKFLGREAQLKKLDNLLRQNSLVFISGGGGIGKTELAAQYAATQADQGKTVVQIHYMPGANDPNDDKLDRSGIRQLLMNLAISNFPPPPTPPAPGALKAQDKSVDYLQQRKDYYEMKLEKLRTLCNEHVLLIIDNFNVESDEGLAELQNILNGGQCIITTWCDYSKLGYSQLKLENSKQDAGWLEQLFRAQCSNPEKLNNEVVQRIIQTVEYHTTAVILLGAQMEADWNDENELLEQLEYGLQNVGKESVGFHKDGMDRMDQRAFGYLKAIFNISSLDQEKRHLLGALSFISSQKFDRDMLLKWIPDVDKVAVNQLVRFRWIEQNAKTGEMHLPQVIADVVFDWASGEFARFLDYLHSFTVWYANLSDSEQYLHLELFRTVAERFLYCAKELDIRAEEDVLSVAAEVGNLITKNLGDQYDTLAENLYKAVQTWYEKLAKEDPTQYEDELAAVCNGFGNLLSSTGQIKKAENSYRKALAIYRDLTEKISAQYSGCLAMICNNLGVLLSHAGRIDEAEDCYREAIVIYQKLAAANPAQYSGDLANTYNSIGDSFRENGRNEEAEAFFRKALAILRDLATKNPTRYKSDVAMACNNLAILLRDTGRVENAEALYREALAIYRDLAAKNSAQHSGTLASICSNYGILLSDIGQTLEAESLYRESLAIHQNLAAANPAQYNGDLANTCNSLGALLSDIGRVEEAEKLLYKALKIRRILAAENPTQFNADLARTCYNLGNLLSKTNRTGKAETLYHEALAIYRELETENFTLYSGDLAMICNNLGNLLKDANRLEDAEDYYREALTILHELASEGSVQYYAGLARVLNNLGNLLSNTARTEEAEKLFREALAIYRKLEAGNPALYNKDLAMICNDFGILLLKSGRTEDAETLFREALVIYRCLVLKNSTQYGNALARVCNNLGILLRYTGRTEEAEELYREVLKIIRILRDYPRVCVNLLSGVE